MQTHLSQDELTAQGFSPTTLQRFWKNVSKDGPNGCWRWMASKRWGYGQISAKRSYNFAHRLSWYIHNGPVPEGLSVLHKCDFMECSNPDHLFLGTQLDNVRDAISKGRNKTGDSWRKSHLATLLSGDKHWWTKITISDVDKIIAMRGTMRQREIASLFGISRSMVSMITHGKKRSLRNDWSQRPHELVKTQVVSSVP